MKRISIALLTLTAALSAVSCQKEAELQEQTSGQMTITALAEQVGAGTRAEMAYRYDVLWQENDEILVKDASSSAIFKLTDGAGTTKGTFTGSTVTGDVSAYYPASLVDEDKLVWPAVQQNNQVAPMYCKKNISTTEEEFSFKSLGAVMQIVLTTPVEGVTLKSIKIEDAAKTMSGRFHVDENGQAVIDATDKAGITLDLGAGVPIDLAAKYFNIAIPAGKYEDLTLTFTTTDGLFFQMRSTTLPEVKRNVVGKLTLVATKLLAPPAKAFSIGDGKWVHFSQGNLVATIDASGAPTDWKFAANQYDCLGEGGANKTIGIAAGDVDLFGWSTSTNGIAATNNYGISTSTLSGDYSGNFWDWGKAIGDGNTWRTLSTDEWQYLFAWDSSLNEGEGGFDTSSPRYGHFKNGVTVCGKKNCVIIAPDNWDTNENPLQASYDATAWAAAEAAGLVCLPAAGRRSGSTVLDACVSGYYWSSSAKSAYFAFQVFYSINKDFNPADDNYRYSGGSVRLVTDAAPPEFVAVTGVTLKESTLELAVGTESTLTATVAPENATNQNVTWSSSDESIATVDQTGKVTAVAAGTATITATTVDGGFTATSTVTVISRPAGSLAGKFSVSADRKVYFSKGNLYCSRTSSDTNDWTWHFYDRQYEFLAADMDLMGKEENSRTIESSEKEIHLFTWGYSPATSFNPIGEDYVTAHTTEGEQLVYDKPSSEGGDDWGVAYCESSGIEVGTWRTLTEAEWNYLFITRTDASNKVGYATVAGINGMIILPDSFTDPMKNNGSDAFVPLPEFYDRDWTNNVYTTGDNWSAMESAGAVFLPGAGYRDESYVDEAGGVGEYGHYWTSSAGDGAHSFLIGFERTGHFYGCSPRSSGKSVRLVTDVQAKSVSGGTDGIGDMGRIPGTWDDEN